MSVAISTGRIGFAVFEGLPFLVDWGTLDMRGANNDERIERICATLAWYLPDAVIVEDVKAEGCMKGARTRLLVERFKKEAKLRKINVEAISRVKVRELFAPLGGRNKDVIARIVTSQFPELSRSLPSKRQTWGHEYYGMATFEAVSFALVYFKRLG